MYRYILFNFKIFTHSKSSRIISSAISARPDKVSSIVVSKASISCTIDEAAHSGAIRLTIDRTLSNILLIAYVFFWFVLNTHIFLLSNLQIVYIFSLRVQVFVYDYINHLEKTMNELDKLIDDTLSEQAKDQIGNTSTRPRKPTV